MKISESVIMSETKTPEILSFLEEFKKAVGNQDAEAAAVIFEKKIYPEVTKVRMKNHLNHAASLVANIYMPDTFDRQDPIVHQITALKAKGHNIASEALELGKNKITQSYG